MKSRAAPSAHSAASPTREAVTEASASPWQQARVGDRVEYAFSGSRFDMSIQLDMGDFLKRIPEPPDRSHQLEGRLALEVVAVRSPWAWLSLTFTDDQGRPHTHPALTRGYVLPMRMEETQPRGPFTPMEGETTLEQATAAGRTWDARRIVQDSRVSDGSLENRLYAVEPGPLYLTQGLLSASSAPAGMSGLIISQRIQLVSFRRGSNAAGTVPGLERPLGPGTWYDLYEETSGQATLQRVCLGAENGHLLSQTWQGATPGEAPACDGFPDVSAVSLGEALFGFVGQAAYVLPRWPPVALEAVPKGRETLSVGPHPVPSIVFERLRGEGDEQTVKVDTYAAEPWSAALNGLPGALRFDALSRGRYLTRKQGPRETQRAYRLAGWGIWMKDEGR